MQSERISAGHSSMSMGHHATSRGQLAALGPQGAFSVPPDERSLQNQIANPGSSTSLDEMQYPEADTLYVNPKQYRRILLRREARNRWDAKVKSAQEAASTGPRGYLHESRHRHAMRRPRGPGGRFLTAEEMKEWKLTGKLPPGSKPFNPGDGSNVANSGHDGEPHHHEPSSQQISERPLASAAAQSSTNNRKRRRSSSPPSNLAPPPPLPSSNSALSSQTVPQTDPPANPIASLTAALLPHLQLHFQQMIGASTPPIGVSQDTPNQNQGSADPMAMHWRLHHKPKVRPQVTQLQGLPCLHRKWTI
ncbi:hypothetical protein M427DRAFT_439935 [Gonapodya prolifera JEL478]|uniref:Transcriptional activator HAP2 n=1 Tax=Gonapodya prolifera (strain JEL478) TaxID=1344416 RepID=A0A139A3E0_GONPJ|nr:hypothetical protein M427DRAFT_439935 [Gonapodya prolifera JEL478]|eukprot:KXS11234.1 hypothetical protein M427DRAFT_439935 [Gonapodya prolifera JEL478]